MAEPVLIDVNNHVATVTLNRPEKSNAVSLDMFDALRAAGRELANNRSVRAVILSGAGSNFCAGIDVSIFSDRSFDFGQSALAPLEDSPANRFQSAAYVWRELPVPVICAIQGAAFGAGLQIALGADVRIASPNARLSIMEIKWGLIPDLGITTTLRNLVPLDRAKELAWTGRVVNAAEARELGLVTEVSDDPSSAAVRMAESICRQSPDAVRAIKRLANEAWQLEEREALALEAALQLGVMGKKNQLEAVAANLESRAPTFED